MEIIFWSILLPLGVIGVGAWIYRMPDHGAVPSRLLFSWNRVLGQYHRFSRGRLLERGEQEWYRGRLLVVKAYSVDRHVIIARQALSIVTDHRVMIQNEQGLQVQLIGGDIRSVRAHRDFDQRDGYSYWVVIERVGSAVHEPEGDLALGCNSQEQCQALFSAIQSITVAVDLIT